MFIQRALVVLTAGPLLLYFIYRGGLFYFIPISVIIFFAAIEYAHMIRALGWQMPLGLLLPAVVIQLAGGQWADVPLFVPTLALSLLVALGYGLWVYERQVSQTAVADWLALTAGIIFLGWIGSHFFRVRGLEENAWQWTMLAMTSTWLADSAAYLVGKFLTNKIFGRHQLSPRLSPNKTVEGYVGGIIVGTIGTMAIANFLDLPLLAALVLGSLVSVVSPAGDLGISLLKRESGIKDSGVLFPGHGGALDRIDSLVWSVTMAYYLALFVQA